MSGIYIHIPFCKQACFYCDFYFSTSLKKKDELIQSILIEIELRKNELNDEVVETIYFGGGTPSLLNQSDVEAMIQAIYKHYKVGPNPEITLEANPDDINEEKLKEMSSSGINRLSIGIQSFFEEDLKLMNRAHNAQESKACLEMATQYFENISLDLIYGIPGSSNLQWRENIQTALSYNIPHLSCYALTVEPGTALESFIKKGIMEEVDDLQAQEQFLILIDELTQHDYIHYELSNFAKKGFYSKNNSSYWQGKTYLGIGPSAHSFDGKQRSWNVKNNSKYIKALTQNQIPIEKEILSITDQYNEYIMTGLRTIWGVSLKKVEQNFGKNYLKYLNQQAEKHILEHLLYIDDGILRTTRKGKFFSDGIASDLFKLNLS